MMKYQSAILVVAASLVLWPDGVGALDACEIRKGNPTQKWCEPEKCEELESQWEAVLELTENGSDEAKSKVNELFRKSQNQTVRRLCEIVLDDWSYYGGPSPSIEPVLVFSPIPDELLQMIGEPLPPLASVAVKIVILESGTVGDVSLVRANEVPPDVVEYICSIYAHQMYIPAMSGGRFVSQSRTMLYRVGH